MIGAPVWNRLSIVFGSLGVFESAVLTLAHVLEKNLPCGASSGCEMVAMDSSSYLGPIPVSALGFALYSVLVALFILRGFGYFERPISALSLLLSGLGTAFSVWLTYHSVVDLGAVCLWCLSSLVSVSLLFFISLGLFANQGAKFQWSALDTVITAGLLVVILPASLFKTLTAAQAVRLRVNLAKLSTLPLATLIPDHAHIRGNLGAPISIVEFGDLSCPACRQMHFRIANLVAHNRNVRLIFRHLPLSQLAGHGASMYAAELAESAPSEALFWRFVDQIYSKPGPLVESQARKVAATVLGSTEVGLHAVSAVSRDIGVANELGINQTPTYLLITPDRVRVPATSTDLRQKLTEPQIVKWLNR